MRVRITYTTSKTNQTRVRDFIKSSVREALAFFNWRYGHKVVDIQII
jgi:hypothetical protein